MTLARVLVVEDERVVALYLRQQLSRLGYEVPFMATKGPQALEAIELHKPDVVLMDIHIEGDMDGIDTASRIPQHLRIPVIYLTAYSEESTLERARVTKPYGYLLKPFSERELHATIQMAIERHRADDRVTQQADKLRLTVAEREEELAASAKEVERQNEQRLKAEHALRQAQKMEAVGQLTGGLAHDFNNLMHVVVGNLEVIARTLATDPDRTRRCADSALQAARRAVMVTQRLLAFASLQPLAPKPINVNGLVSGMSDLLHRTLEESIGVKTVLGSGIWMVEVDPNQLESAVLNLVVNARDAMQGVGRLTIETHNTMLDRNSMQGTPDVIPGEYVSLAVTDSGCGMEQSVIERAVEPFFTTKEVGKGTGLGLSQVYGFTKQSGGYLKIHSTVGQGTSVEIFLPRFIGEASAEAQSNGWTPVKSVGNETILIVEDDDDVRLFSVEILRELGYRVLEAEDGPTAIGLIRNDESIDLLFTDVVLPGGLNGAALAAEALAIRPTLAVLYTSGYDRNAISNHGRLAAGVELITKPFSYDALTSRVRQILDARTSEKSDSGIVAPA
jgi:signal transduction histidine kinase